MCNLLSLNGLGARRVLVLLGILLLLPLVAGHAEVKQEITDALNAGDTALAIELLHEQIELDPGYHANYHALGQIYMKRGKPREARAHFEKALEEKDNHWESQLQLGRVLLRLGEIDSARVVMERGREEADDMKAEFEDGYGLVMIELGKYSKADRAFRQALVYDSTQAEYHIHLGDANYHQGIYPLAISEYEKALKIDTASLEVYFHWAEACLEMRDYACALEKLRVVLTKDSTHAEAWNRAGSIYFKAALSSRSRDERINRFRETVGSYRKYFELAEVQPDSEHVRPYFEIAMAYVNLRGYEDAAENFEKVLAIPYEPRDIYFYYAKSLWGLREYEKVGEMLDKHLAWVEEQGDDYRSTVRDAEIEMLYGDSYYYRKPKNFTKAIEHYKNALEANPTHKRLLQNVAVGYHNLQSYKQALEYYQRRVDEGIDEKSAALLKNAGYCALNLAKAGSPAGESDLADIDADLGIEMPAAANPDPDVDYTEMAASLFEDYLSYEPDDAVKVVEILASTYLYQMGDCTNGVKYYSRLLELDPDNCEASKSLGYAYFGGVCTTSYSKALRYLTEAYSCKAKASGACADVDLVLYIAQAYHLRAVEKANADKAAGDDFKNAYDWYGKVLKCEPGNQEAEKGQADTRFEF